MLFPTPLGDIHRGPPFQGFGQRGAGWLRVCAPCLVLLGAGLLTSHCIRTSAAKEKTANIAPTVHAARHGFCFCCLNATLDIAEADRHMSSPKAGSSVTVETGHQLLL